MATWAAKSAMQGSESSETASSCLSSPPSSPPLTPTTTTTPTITTTPTMDDCMDDSGFHDWMELQLGVTGEMSVVERLQYLLDTGQFADVNIRVGQGSSVTVFKAHRLLLATASQPLYRLLQQATPGPGPNDMSTLRIADMKPADFQNILKYIYTDQVQCDNINVAFGLLRASRKWGLAGLGIKSLTYLEEFVDNFEPTTEDAKDNLFDLLVLSEDTLAELSAKCWQIILKHAPTVIPCRGYLNLDKTMAQKVICHPELKMDDQLKLFEAIRDWGLTYIEHQGLPITALGTVVEELIKAVDFEKISDTDFLGTVLTSECLGKAEVIAFFMTHGLEIPRKLDFNNNKQIPFWLTFCATSGRYKNNKGKNTKRLSASSTSSTSSPSSLAPVSEALTSICSLTQNGSMLEFNKVCRFKKGYRCPPKEIYQQHELRFRVDKNVMLLGVGFGFLFTPTDMGLNIHCQGPWETRQWTDIIQSYVRFSGEKQEHADVRLMFLHPVRIEANQSYKVVVKMVRMSHGSNEVELWGGTGGVSCVETEDAEFCFIKAAVDPGKRVEETDGDTNPGVITELLYRLDTGEPEPAPQGPVRRKRPQVEEATSPTNLHTNPWRRRTRPDSLRIPEPSSYARKRSPATDDKSPEPAVTVRRRERSPPEEYKPTSFSTNRWRTKPKENKEEKTAEDYLPSTFSTNRWARSRPKEDTTYNQIEKKKSSDEYKPTSFSTNRWARPKEEKKESPNTQTERNTAQEEYRPSSFSTNRWARPKEEKESTDTQTIRKSSAPEEYRPSSFSTNRWARPKEDNTDASKKEVERKTSAPEYRPSSFSTNRWARPKEDKKESTEEIERKKSAPEVYKPSSFSTNRWASKPKEEASTEPSSKISSEDNRWRTRPQDGVADTPFGVRRRSSIKTEDPPASHPFARRRESKDATADLPFFLRKTEDNKSPVVSFGRNRFGGPSTTTATSSSSGQSTTTPSSTRSAGDTTFHSRFLRSSGSSSASPYSTSRFGSVRDSSLPRFTGGYLSRYDPSSTSDSSSSRVDGRQGLEGRGASPQVAHKAIRYGTSVTSSGSNLLAFSSSSFGLGSAPGNKTLDRYGGSTASSDSYGRSGTPGSSSFNRYSTTGTSSRYGPYDTTRSNSTSSNIRYGSSSRLSSDTRMSPASSRLSPNPRTRTGTGALGPTSYSAGSGNTGYGTGNRYSSPSPSYSRTTGIRYTGSGSSSRFSPAKVISSR